VSGCLKGVLRLGCLALVVAAGVTGWWFRDPILRAASRRLGAVPHRTALPPVADTTVGAPTPKALHSTQSKIDRLRKPSGPDSVVLSADEIASLVGSGIDWSVRKSFDSLRVELLEGSIAVYCRLDTRVIPPDALGPLTGMLRPMEPLRIAGPLRIERPGVARWTIEELSLRGFSFPGLMVKQLAQRVAGAAPDGAVPLRISPAFQDLAIHPTAVILYRHRRRPS
jgi:hypothetical protein